MYCKLSETEGAAAIIRYSKTNQTDGLQMLQSTLEVNRAWRHEGDIYWDEEAIGRVMLGLSFNIPSGEVVWGGHRKEKRETSIPMTSSPPSSLCPAACFAM